MIRPSRSSIASNACDGLAEGARRVRPLRESLQLAPVGLRDRLAFGLSLRKVGPERLAVDARIEVREVPFGQNAEVPDGWRCEGGCVLTGGGGRQVETVRHVLMRAGDLGEGARPHIGCPGSGINPPGVVDPLTETSLSVSPIARHNWGEVPSRPLPLRAALPFSTSIPHRRTTSQLGSLDAPDPIARGRNS